MHNLLSQLAAVLAALSFVLMLGDVRKYAFASDRISATRISELAWSDQEFLISLAMAVVGIFTILMWDTLFPDRRDGLILGSLPVRMRTIFRAKVTAIAAALGLTVLAVNAFTGLVYPFLVIPEHAGAFGFVRSFAAYWGTMAAASLFTFFMLLAMQGVALHLLPHCLFLRVSGYLQLTAFFVVVSSFFLMPSLANPRSLIDPGSQLQLKIIPSFWFLGLFQELNGTARPEFAWLAQRAGWGLLIVSGVAITAYVLAYGGYVRRIVEQSGVVPSDRNVAANGVLRALARNCFPQPLSRAIFLFTARTLARSRQHRMLMAIYGGIGLSVALLYLRELIYRQDAHGWKAPDVPLLAAITVLLFFIVTGLRTCFALPVEPRANWIFRLTEMQDIRVYAKVVRQTLLMLAPGPFWFATAILLFTLWPWKPAAGYLLIQLLFSLLVVSVALGKFRKIPFTCTYLPGKANLKVTLGAYAILILSIADFGVRVELVSLGSLGRILILAALLAAGLRWSAVRARRAIMPPDNRLQFEEQAGAEASPLDLRSDQGRYRADTHLEPARSRGSLLRMVSLITVGIAVVVFLYEQVSGWFYRREYPQIGQRVDIGGRKLNLYCTGQGGPAVLLEAGGNTPGYGWVLVQPEIAKFTRACWYDRAGYGWSDPGSLTSH